MLFANKNRIILFLVISIIYISAWMIQDQLFLNWDVSWLLHAATRLLEGGTYTNDFFGPNPPMILFLYLPPVLLNKLFSINLIVAFRLYVFCMASASLLMCYILTSSLFVAQDQLLRKIFLISLASIFLIYPLYLFGQREHLLIIMTLPYLLLTTCRLQGKTVKPYFALVIGLMAGCGFAIKPQFLPTLVLVELYYTYVKRNVFAWMRYETLAILFVLIAHIGVIFLFYGDYFSVVTPIVLQTYYRDLGLPWKKLLLFSPIMFCYLPALIYVLQYKNKTYRIFNNILFLALLGFFLSYFLQQTLFSYHLIPPVSLALLLLVLQYGCFATQPHLSKTDYLVMTFGGVYCGLFLFTYVYAIWATLILYPISFFLFFTVLFIFLFGVTKIPIVKIISATLFAILVGYIVFYLALASNTFTHYFVIVIFTLISVFGLLADKSHRSFFQHTLAAVIGMLIFAYPIYYMISMYHFGITYKKTTLYPLIAFMRQQTPHPSIYTFSFLGNYNFPLIDYIDGKFVQRMDCMWRGIDLVRKIEIQGDQAARLYIKENINPHALIAMITNDLHTHKPDYVWVDVNNPNFKINDRYLRLDYLSYFMENQDFKNEWKAYRYLTTIDNTPAGNIKLQVYKRITEVVQ